MKKYGSWEEQEDTKFRSNGQAITLAPPGSPGSDFTITLPNEAATLIGRTTTDIGTDRLLNKDLDSPTITFLDASSGNKRLKFGLTAITAGQTRTMTIPDSDFTVTGNALTQTLTNKTIDVDNNTVSNVENDNIKAAAAIALNKLAAVTINSALISDASGFIIPATTTAAELNDLAGREIGGNATGDILTTNNTQTVKGKTFSQVTPGSGAAFTIRDGGDNHNYTIVPADAISNRALTIPDPGGDDTFVFANAAQTLIGKQLTNPKINENVNLTVTSTTLNYVDISAPLQNQIDQKVNASILTTNEDIFVRKAGAVSRLGVGSVGQVLTVNGSSEIVWDSPAGTGDVTAASNIDNNVLVTGDGGAKGIKGESGTGFVEASSGVPSYIGSTGTGNVARAASPTFTGTVNAAAISLSDDLVVDTTLLVADQSASAVGINTASPSHVLTVNAPADGDGLMLQEAGTNRLAIEPFGSFSYLMELQNATGALAFGNNSGGPFNEWARFTSAGDLALGITSPSADIHLRRATGQAKIQVQADTSSQLSSVQYDNDSINYNTFVGGSTNSTSAWQNAYVIRYNGSSDRFSINSSGKLTLGTTNGGQIHQINGATSTTIGAAGSASALPANPRGYLIFDITGATGGVVQVKIPYYNT